MAVLSHTVVCLAVHEPNKETIYWKKGNEEGKLAALKRDKPTSQLTAFFALCREVPAARSYTYPEMTEHYLLVSQHFCRFLNGKHIRWLKTGRKWKARRRSLKTLPRIYTVNPKFTELFCIRLLVEVVKGPQSFEDLRTLDDGTVCETFCQAAQVSNTATSSVLVL